MIKVLSFLALLFLVCCSPAVYLKKEIRKAEKDLQDHTGFMLYDPSSQKTLVEYKSSQYFTPASNTKIFTLYTGLQLLGDSVLAIKYQIREDSLIFWGMGDPSLLYKNVFQNSRVLSFLASSKQSLFFSESNFQTDRFGVGWSWDDYNYDYSPERSSLPIYGNLISVSENEQGCLTVTPTYFEGQVVNGPRKENTSEVIRDVGSNRLTFFQGDKHIKDTVDIPFHVDGKLIANLLSDTLNRVVTEINRALPNDALLLRSGPSDSLYRVMMQDSDNFIAEQILMMSAAVLSDTLKPEIAIDFMTKNFLADLPDKLVWVDGSGLSRFNLFTPRNIVKLWEKIGNQVPHERLIKLLAVGGKSGTLKNSYKSEIPYVYGKTGTLSNNHSLSGFVLTKTGRKLIFSYMSANFVVPASEVRKRMELILRSIHDKY
ncbi:MAG: D-alanyl-D-alanine carboxypeptidase [Bacteroidia bacterium]|nr:D-alanyl-D-alanine carboxypeptidase [Bacteroidia bacterium]